MNQIEVEKILSEIPSFAEQAERVSRGIHGKVLEGGKDVRKGVDLLHGTWLGHPLHPVLTDVTIGAWVFGNVLDLFSLTGRSKEVEKAADRLISIGNLSAVATALAGLADYSTIPRGAMSTGAAHALLNVVGLGLNVLSSLNRRAGNRSAGILLTSAASSVLLISAWLGGELTYRYRVGVNKTPKPSGPENWMTAIREEDLPERTPVRVEVDGYPILLYRYEGQIYAIGAVCAHEGGPLEQGDFEGLCVTCPWHQSVYDLRDGSVVHGPATYAAPRFEVRRQNGEIEVRLLEKPLNQLLSRARG